MLKIAAVMFEKDKEEKKQEREAALSERVPPLQLSGLSLQDLQALCKELHHKIDVVDEDRYDIEAKVSKNNKEIENLSQKIFELKGKMKRPALKRVKISADAMLGALLGAKVKESVDFKVNLKTVKKEEEKKEEVTDWRKNVEAMSGMEGRKKLFDSMCRGCVLTEAALNSSAFLLHAIPHHPPLLSTILLSYQIKAHKNLFRLHCITLCQNSHGNILLMKRTREILSLSIDLMGLEILTVQKKPFLHIHFLFFPQIRLLAVAAQMLQEEKEQKLKEREATLAERVPPLSMSGLSLQELLDLCKDLHHKIDVVDEERYDTGLKVSKNDQEIENMNLKIIEIQSKFKKPTLKRVKISAEAMLSVLLGGKHKESFDFKANLKTVKKEEEKKEEVTDWRKNVEAMSGMEGRMKLFNASGN
ncbi:uncharacterized protein AB9X84_012854 [Acanthopagrus schlegelii]